MPADIRHGFRFADVVIPIGADSAVLLDLKRTRFSREDEVVVPVRSVTEETIRGWMLRLMTQAEALGASEFDEGLGIRFMRTERREQVRVSRVGPYIITQWNR